MQVSSIIGIDVGGGESNLNLDQVLLNGNISTRDAKVGGIFAYNPHLGSGLGYVSITGDKNRFNFYNNTNLLIGQLQQDSIFLKNSSNASGLFISKPTTTSANRIATFQDADGTVAYLSNIPLGRVPYTGATQSVNLGSNDIFTTGGAKLSDDGFVYGQGLYLYDGPNANYAYMSYNDDFFSLLRPGANTTVIECDNGFNLAIQRPDGIGVNLVNGVTASRTYQFPNASGTFALTSDLVGLTGYVTIATTQTITGTKTFTNNLTIDSVSSSRAFFRIGGSGSGTITSNTSLFVFEAFNSNGYAFLNGSSTNLLSIGQNGIAAFSSLTGSGTRMVVANATGQLSTQAISDLSGFVTLATTQTITAPSKTFTNPVTVGSTVSGVYTTIAQNYIDIRNGNDISTGWLRVSPAGLTRTKNGFSTNLFTVDPVANTTLNLPAKTVGTYTIATVEDLTGFVTLGTTQTIIGLKTFTDSLRIASPTVNPQLLFDANGVITANVTCSTGFFQFTANNSFGYLFKNTSSVNTLTLDQTGNAEFLGNISHRPLVSPASWVSQLGSDISGAQRRGALRLREMSNGTGFIANVIPTDLTADRTYTLPDATGTIALTSDLTGFVTLATTQTISGAKTFTSNVGIGTTTPVQKLDVVGSIQASVGYRLKPPYTSDWAVLLSYSGNGISANGTLSLRSFSTGAGFFTTLTAPTLSADRSITIPDATGTMALTSDLTGFVTLATTQTITGAKTFSQNTTFSGTVTASGGFFNSDARLKDVIERDGDTVKFTWKDKRDDKTHIGYIAQEVQEKYPDQVNENEDGMLTVNYIEVLVAKIQELENRIKQLEK